VGTFGHKEFVPHHQTLLCCQQNKNIPTLEISEQKSLEVMQGKTLEIDGLMIQEVHTKSDWIILTYQNIPLSWAKVNEKRINTFYPKELRIAD
jgi:NOL1/NOP2/fmu family ribosome biogenesis protein